MEYLVYILFLSVFLLTEVINTMIYVSTRNVIDDSDEAHFSVTSEYSSDNNNNNRQVFYTNNTVFSKVFYNVKG